MFRKNVWNRLPQPMNFWNHQLKEQQKMKIYKRNQWIPPPKDHKLKQDPKGTKKKGLPELDRQFMRDIYEAAQNKDLEKALDAYHKLKKGRADVRIYTALISTCNQEELLPEAFAFYKDMKSAKIPPNLVTFQTLLECCVTNNHLERALYVLKEFLQTEQSKSESPLKDRFFNTLLKLCYKSREPGRAVAIYKIMNNIEQEEIEIPLEFVQRFLGKSFEAKNFHYEMNRTIHPDIVKVKSRFEQIFGDLINAGKETQESGDYLEGDIFMNNLHKFPLKTDNELLNHDYQEIWENIYNRLASPINDRDPFPNDTPSLREARQQKMKNLFDSCGDPEKIKKVFSNFRYTRKDLINHKKSKFKWTPVIFGVDEDPFYPSKLTINNVSEKSVKEAKMEYLSTIRDIDIREEVEKELNDRIRIHWKDENGEFIEGITH